MREDFQIPPFFSDKQLERYAKEGNDYFDKINPGCNPDEDLTYRSLLKNYMYYAVYHRVNEFMENYRNAILTWQMETEVETEESNDSATSIH